jgi:syntaxin 1A/syntaxin 1B/2/3
LEAGDPNESTSFLGKDFGTLLGSCGKIQQKIRNLEENVEKMFTLHQELTAAIRQDDLKNITAAFEALFGQVKQECRQIQMDIEQIKADGTLLAGSSPSDAQIITRNADAMLRGLQSTLLRAQTAHGDFQGFSRKQLARQIKGITPSEGMTEDAIEQMIEEDPMVVNKLVQESICGKNSAQVLNAAQDILEKCEGIKRLQTQVRELVEMIKDIAQLLSEQGVQIDSIAQCISEAKDHVTSAREKLVKAKEHNEAARCVSSTATGVHDPLGNAGDYSAGSPRLRISSLKTANQVKNSH